MKTFPFPAIVAAIAAVSALPFSLVGAGTLFLTAGLGLILHADYTLRYRRIRLPRRLASGDSAMARAALCRETHQLAA